MTLRNEGYVSVRWLDSYWSLGDYKYESQAQRVWDEFIPDVAEMMFESLENMRWFLKYPNQYLFLIFMKFVVKCLSIKGKGALEGLACWQEEAMDLQCLNAPSFVSSYGSKFASSLIRPLFKNKNKVNYVISFYLEGSFCTSDSVCSVFLYVFDAVSGFPHLYQRSHSCCTFSVKGGSHFCWPTWPRRRHMCVEFLLADALSTLLHERVSLPKN